jgi:hypothetical protein
MTRPSAALATLLFVSFTVDAPEAKAGDADAGGAARPSLLVLPFPAVSAEVPSRAGAKAAGMLAKELESAEAFSLVAAPPSEATPVDDGEDALAARQTPDLEAARAGIAEARSLRAKKKFRLAAEQIAKALSRYRAGAAALTDVGEVQDALTLLAAVQYQSGLDEPGAKTLAAALALAPTRELPLARTSPLFAFLVADVRKSVRDGAKGSVLLQSVPNGAPVLFDGQPLGATPLRVKGVPVGPHYWRAELLSGAVVGGEVEVVQAREVSLVAAETHTGPEERLLAALARNNLDAPALAAARELASTRGVDLLVLGALSRDGRDLALDLFVLDVRGMALRRLGRPVFDDELLSAGVEFFTLAGALSQHRGKAGVAANVPSAVVLGPSPVTSKLREASYGPVPGTELASEALEPAEPAKNEAAPTPASAPKADEPQRRRPLKKR